MKVCTRCGAQNKDDAGFCTSCGQPLTGAAGAQTPPPTGQFGGAAVGGQPGGNAQRQGVPVTPPPTGGQQWTGSPAGTVYGAAPADPYDHTAEFDPRDISENKVFAMLIYLMGTIGIIIALLASARSPYVAFHVRQGLKITVITILTGIITLLLCWTVIVPIIALIFMAILHIVKIICFFRICGGTAKEAYIVRGFGFLK